MKGELVSHQNMEEDDFFNSGRNDSTSSFGIGLLNWNQANASSCPKGTEHRTCADKEALLLCFEPAGVLNYGNVRLRLLPDGGQLRTWGGYDARVWSIFASQRRGVGSEWILRPEVCV